MGECFISFASVKDIQDFVSINTRKFFSVFVDNGQLHTDGRSLMILCCMGLNRPLKVRFPAAEAGDFLQAVKQYLIA